MITVIIDNIRHGHRSEVRSGKINANIQGVYHRPKLERACNVGCRLFVLEFVIGNCLSFSMSENKAEIQRVIRK